MSRRKAPLFNPCPVGRPTKSAAESAEKPIIIEALSAAGKLSTAPCALGVARTARQLLANVHFFSNPFPGRAFGRARHQCPAGLAGLRQPVPEAPGSRPGSRPATLA